MGCSINKVFSIIYSQIRNPELHTYLYQQLQNIQQKCVRKEHLLDEIQRLEKDINDQNSMIQSLKSGAKELEREFSLCTTEASQLLKVISLD
jgi:predicted nuclease with TOPRIM domain